MLPLRNIQIWPTDLLVQLRGLKATVVIVSPFHFWPPAQQFTTGSQTLLWHFDVGSCCWLLVLWAVLWVVMTYQSPLSKHSCEFACDNAPSFSLILLSCASCLGSNLSSCAPYNRVTTLPVCTGKEECGVIDVCAVTLLGSWRQKIPFVRRLSLDWQQTY